MKKNCLIFVIILQMFTIAMPVAQAESPPRVVLDGQELSFDVPPIVVDGRVLVPLGGIFKTMGYPVHWEGNDQSITAQINQQYFWMKVNDDVAYIQDRAIHMDVPAQIVDDRVMVPLRVIAEACLCKVEYNESSNTVSIFKGTKQVEYYSIYKGYDPFTVKGIDVNARDINSKSPQVFAEAGIIGNTDSAINIEWAYITDSSQELAETQTEKIAEGKVYSILPREKYKTGQWIVALKINGQIVQSYSFKINNSSGQYGNLHFPNGEYEGYLEGNNPVGYGEIKMKDGTKIIAGFSKNKGVYAPFKDLTSQELNPLDIGVTTSNIEGCWLYPDGSKFDGTVFPLFAFKNQEDLDRHIYDLYYDVKGTFVSADGNRRQLSGYYKGFEPSFRFDQFVKDGSAWDVVKN
ncbi:MAG TPA: copper amine oxidase N-terminal domain-containing protein [Syntrophomonadaceae bacterium]|nr:copper amine oxidase N-terminal domain-containing protein [Syntrophomonadaceae bacterium]